MKTRRQAIVRDDVTMASNCPLQASCEATFNCTNGEARYVRCGHLSEVITPKHSEAFVVCSHPDC